MDIENTIQDTCSASVTFETKKKESICENKIIKVYSINKAITIIESDEKENQYLQQVYSKSQYWIRKILSQLK